MTEIAHLVRFEEMIQSPLKFAQEVCNVSGLDIEQHARELGIWAARVQDTNNDKFVEATTSKNYSRPDHTVRVGRWTENLTHNEIDDAVKLVSSANRHFSYQLPEISG